MESIALAAQERKTLIRQMKRETKPSRRLRMHIVLLRADGYSPSQIARVLYCSRTTIYATTQRFGQEGAAGFTDRQPRGPAPRLEPCVQQRLETLVEQELPLQHGFLRLRWTCKLLALQLLAERGLAVSRQLLLPGRDEAGPQPQSGLCLDETGAAAAVAHTEEEPQALDFGGVELGDRPPALRGGAAEGQCALPEFAE
jgi:transposase